MIARNFNLNREYKRLYLLAKGLSLIDARRNDMMISKSNGMEVILSINDDGLVSLGRNSPNEISANYRELFNYIVYDLDPRTTEILRSDDAKKLKREMYVNFDKILNKVCS